MGTGKRNMARTTRVGARHQGWASLGNRPTHALGRRTLRRKHEVPPFLPPPGRLDPTRPRHGFLPSISPIPSPCDRPYLTSRGWEAAPPPNWPFDFLPRLGGAYIFPGLVRELKCGRRGGSGDRTSGLPWETV